ncbi:hypothetical protein Syun_023830 [Stephania yunnanensis]|uniref:Uncharacterized protein n=1 Tax=Stephania yunnanensis TaxID=152371 RepID=A0AAP0I3W5_9MAGN
MRGSSKVITMDVAKIESFLMEVEIFFKDEQAKYDEFLQIMISFQDNSCRMNVADILRRAKYLFKGNTTLLLGLNHFVPSGYEINDAHSPLGIEEEPPAHSNDKVRELVDEIKNQLKDDVFTWNRFLDTLNLYRSCSWNIETTLRQLGVIFKDKEYFLKHFDFFSQNPTKYLKQQQGSRETLHKDLKLFEPSSPSGNKAKLLGDSLLMKKDGQSKSTPTSPYSAQRSSVEGSNDEESNDISEFDRSANMRISPEHRLLLKNDQVPEDELLNSQSISLASSDTEISSTSTHQKKCGGELSEDEDQGLEVDVLLGSLELAVEHAEKRLTAIEAVEPTTTVVDPLSVEDLKLIERMYGDRGLEVIELLHTNETCVLPVVLRRLKQKKKEFEEYRSEFNKY